MAEQILFDDLYNQLTPEERNEYGGYKIARGLGGEEDANTMAEGTNFQEIFDAQQAAKATKPSAWNPLNWIFSPAASSEMPQNKYGLQTNTMGGVTLNPDGSLNYNNQSPNLGFRSMVDMAADTENFDNQFNNNFADYNMSGPLRGTNTMRGSVIGPDMSIRDYQSPMGTDVIGMDETNTYGNTIAEAMIDEDRIPGRIQESVPNYQNWFERMMSGAQDKLGGAWGKTKELGSRFKEKAGPVFGLASMFANATNPLNPKSFNYNPNLKGQLDFMDKEMGGWSTNNPGTGLLQYAQGTPLQGQNVFSGFGSNDPIAQLEKQMARHQKTIDKIPDQWSNLDDQELKDKIAIHQKRYDDTQAWHTQLIDNRKAKVAALALKEQQKEARKKQQQYTAPQHHQDVSINRGDHQAKSFRSAPKGVTTSSGMHGGKHYAQGGRVGYANGGLASLFTRRG